MSTGLLPPNTSQQRRGGRRTPRRGAHPWRTTTSEGGIMLGLLIGQQLHLVRGTRGRSEVARLGRLRREAWMG